MGQSERTTLTPPGTRSREATLSSPVEIRIENVYKSFGKRPVLDGINFETHSGEMLDIVGGSRSGKSTLLRHIIGREQADRGRVLLADHESAGSPLVDLATLDDEGMESLARYWGVVFQSNALLSGQCALTGLPTHRHRIWLDSVQLQRSLDSSKLLRIATFELRRVIQNMLH